MKLRTLQTIVAMLAVIFAPVASPGQAPPAQAPAASPGQSARAQAPDSVPPPSTPAKRSAAELQKLAEPIALHPDQLIAIILPAAAYPVEIVQAARFVKDTNNIAKLDEQPWDDNVKEVAKFPELIAKMNEDLTWTVDLGQAFIDQPKELMDTIQDLRSKAQKAGNLKTTQQQIVTVTNIVVQQTNVTEVVNTTKEIIQVAPANPSVVYVPSYPPTVYAPWYPYYAYAAPLISFGVGMAWGAIWANNCNWNHGCVDVDIDSNRNVNRNVNRDTNRGGDRTGSRPGDRPGSGVGDRPGSRPGDRPGNAGQRPTQQPWKPDQSRLRNSGGSGPSASTREARGWGSGSRPSTGNAGARPSTGNVGARPSTGSVGQRPSTGAAGGSRYSPPQSSSRPSASPSRSSSSGSAFKGASGGGSSARSASSRGASSRSSGGFSGGSRGGGRSGGRGGGRGR